MRISIGMALYSEASYEDVVAQLTDGLSWASGWTEAYTAEQVRDLPGAGQAWAEPLVRLFERVAKPIGDEDTPGVCGRRRLVAVDGMCLDVADTSTPSTSGRPG